MAENSPPVIWTPRLERIARANAHIADLVIILGCSEAQRRKEKREFYLTPPSQPYCCDTNYNPRNNLTCPPGWGEDPTSN